MWFDLIFPEPSMSAIVLAIFMTRWNARAERLSFEMACFKRSIDCSSRLQNCFNCLLFISAFEVIFKPLNLLS